jgi:hypothetical protein
MRALVRVGSPLGSPLVVLAVVALLAGCAGAPSCTTRVSEAGDPLPSSIVRESREVTVTTVQGTWESTEYSGPGGGWSSGGGTATTRSDTTRVEDETAVGSGLREETYREVVCSTGVRGTVPPEAAEDARRAAEDMRRAAEDFREAGEGRADSVGERGAASGTSSGAPSNSTA